MNSLSHKQSTFAFYSTLNPTLRKMQKSFVFPPTHNNITILDNFDTNLPPPPLNPNILKRGISVFSQFYSKGIFLNNNTINLRAWNNSDGIFVSFSHAINVNNNLIRRFQLSQGTGIHMLNNDQRTYVNCNSSQGMDPIIMAAQNQAYFLENSASFLADNYSHQTKAGFAFNAPCTGVDIKHNQMGEHLFDPINLNLPSGAMHFGTNATFGILEDKFNMFADNAMAFKVATTNFDRFTYSNTWPINSPTYVPSHIPALNPCAIDPFFRCTGTLTDEPGAVCGADPDNTGSIIQGMMITNPSGTTSVANALVAGQLNYAVYNEESKFEVAKSIHKAYKEQSIDLPSTLIFESWKDSIANSNVAKLNAFTSQWKKNNIESTHQQIMDQWEMANKEAFDFAVAYYQSIEQPEDFQIYEVQQGFLELLSMQESANNLLDLLKGFENNRLQATKDSAEYYNQAIVEPMDYEEMERTINDIFLKTIAIGEFEFTPEQMSRITQIAFQCPLKSASAVYKAREMYALDYPLQNFDNYLLCANQGIQYRQGNTNTINVINVSQLSDRLQIEIVGETDFLNYRIINSLGQLVYQWSSNNKVQNITLENIIHAPGLYILQAQNSDGIQSIKKFIYTK